jgi:hypothetical protein
VAGTLALLVPVTCSERGPGMAKDISAVVLHGGVGKGWVAAKLDSGIDEGGVTSELGGIAEWARERGGEDEHGGNGADNVEGGGFN